MLKIRGFHFYQKAHQHAGTAPSARADQKDDDCMTDDNVQKDDDCVKDDNVLKDDDSMRDDNDDLLFESVLSKPKGQKSLYL